MTEIVKDCGTCGGDGIVTLDNAGQSGDIQCWQCGGSGKVPAGTIPAPYIDDKLDSLQSDVDLMKTALQKIWNKLNE